MSEVEFREIAKRVSNWGRWGPDDERGTLNLITPEVVKRATGCVRRGRVFTLGLPFGADGPQPGVGLRFNPMHYMSAIGQSIGGGSLACCYSDDIVHMPLQCATQWDALAHVHYEGQLYNGFRADEVLNASGASRGGIDKAAVDGIVSRGVLLDVARQLGVERLAADVVIEPADLDAAARAARIEPGPGDILLVRTGHIRVFTEDRNCQSFADASPGLGMACAEWLRERDIAAVCADNVAVEPLPGAVPGVPIPLHMLCIRDMGMLFGEMLDLEALARDCAEDGVYEFLFAAPPLAVTRGIGSPINPVAVK
jgi:kynurenine formamidase